MGCPFREVEARPSIGEKEWKLRLHYTDYQLPETNGNAILHPGLGQQTRDI